MGHSLGGLTTYEVAYNTCCRDSRILAAVAIEAPVGPFFPGTFIWTKPPVLIIQGDEDPVIPATTGQTVLAHFNTPAYLLTIFGGDHGGGMDESDPGHADAIAAIANFLDAYLKDDRRALRRLQNMRRDHQTELCKSSSACSIPPRSKVVQFPGVTPPTTVGVPSPYQPSYDTLAALVADSTFIVRSGSGSPSTDSGTSSPNRR